MAKYCVQAELKFTTQNKRDDATKEALLKFGLRKVWGETNISAGIEDGYPTQALTVRFVEEKDMDECYDYIKEKMQRIPVLHGTVSKHICYHDETPPKPCVVSERYEI